MPSCFQLINKETGEAEKFSKIDDKICAYFGVKPDPKKYVYLWYDIIGFNLATGKSFEEQREMEWLKNDPELMQIIDFLDENYTSNNWYEHKY